MDISINYIYIYVVVSLTIYRDMMAILWINVNDLGWVITPSTMMSGCVLRLIYVKTQNTIHINMYVYIYVDDLSMFH